MNEKYNKTILACFVGYSVQAIVNNFVPLLFVTFQKSYQIPLSQITMLVTFNFGIQLLVDLLSVKVIDKLGYRISMVAAHIFSALGFLLLTILPDLLPSAFAGILIAVMVYAVGGGILEVLVSPIMESCPTDNKEKAMSLLHSFYCWGYVAVILISTIFFRIFGIQNWKILAVVWAILPITNAISFCVVPIAPLMEEGEEGLSLKEILKNKFFWLFFVMMLCAGASEQSISQWASTFMEKSLGIAKTVGDLAGPMSFAVLMGISRLIYGKYGERMRLERFMMWSTILCIASYLVIALCPNPQICLVFCALGGLSVGIMWPGTFSKSAAILKNGGTAVFSLLALAGDLGCAGGPTLVGFVSNLFQENLKIGILAGVIFPILLLIGIFALISGEKGE